ncbi:MAG: 3-deoxy-D-manno-octulosonate 8-phosphate phosphatase KdsC [Elusimicrobia bacterium]|nr:3-deoxy-D-manno-octulosonate 8-phosphate phosphatase KdsC [Elusimicrobiota bacterium]
MPLKKAQLVKRAKIIKIIGMDVDGVLTNGDVVVRDSGEEVKAWNAKDRLCLALIRDRGVPLEFAWITGRSSKTVESNANDLGIQHLVQKCSTKKEAFEKILKSRGVSFEEAAYIGDDLIDIPVMRAVGFSACPADAVPDVLKRSHYVSSLEGGRGAVRDILEFILKAQGRWDGLIASFLQ